MAVYIVTGKLGAGKTLLMVLKIKEYLKGRRKVAVNLNIRMDKMCKADNKHSNIVRIPDLPTAEDLIGLGFGSDVYDEDKFGGIFLDEAGVWLNSHEWNKNGRKELFTFFLFLRKRRWDLWLAVQNVNVIDKQIRESIAEHVVYINRWDKMRVPFPFGPLGRLLTLGIWKGKLPKMHQAIVKLGAKHLAPKVDDWFYRGEDAYALYDTTQEYNKDYDKGSYCMLPPGYWKRVIPRSKRVLGFYMRTTKIFFKRFRVVNAFFLGAVVSLVLTTLVYGTYVLGRHFVAPVVSTVSQPSKPKESKPLEFSNYRIASYVVLPGRTKYIFLDDSGKRVTQEDLEVKGFIIKDRGSREALVVKDDQFQSIYR